MQSLAHSHGTGAQEADAHPCRPFICLAGRSGLRSVCVHKPQEQSLTLGSARRAANT